MVKKRSNGRDPSEESDDPDDHELAEALGEFLDRLAEDDPRSAREFIEEDPQVRANLAYELAAVNELDSMLDSEKPPSTFGEFVLVDEIGRGGMGIVYKAWQPSLTRHVALKVLPTYLLADKEHVERFERGARAAASLSHPNIVAVHAMGVENDQPYVVMELVEGETLLQAERRMQSTRLHGNTPGGAGLTPRELFDSPQSGRSEASTRADLMTTEPELDTPAGDGDEDESPEDESAAEGIDRKRQKGRPRGYARQLDAAYAKRVADAIRGAAVGLQHAHSNGVVHRDIKPSNLIKDSDGRVRILDFGLARAEGMSRLTASSEHLGTLPYMCPEQAQGRSGDFGPAIDIFGLGASLYEMLTWTAPFEGENAADIVRQVLRCDPRPVRWFNPNVHRDLETVVMKCLREDPRERYASAGELARHLSLFVAGEPVPVRPLPWVVRTARRAWKARARVASVSATAALLITLALVAWSMHDRAERDSKNEWKARVSNASSGLSVSTLAERSRSHTTGPGAVAELAPQLEGDGSDGGIGRLYVLSANPFTVGPISISIQPQSFLDAVIDLKQAAAQRPEEAIVHYHLARAELIQGDLSKAVIELGKARSANPDCVPALCLLATVLEGANDPAATEALARVDLLAKTPGTEWAASFLKVQRAERRNEWSDAVSAYRELRSLRRERELFDGDRFEILFGLGVARMREGDLLGALADLGECRGLSSQRIEPRLLIGRISILREQPEMAERTFGDLIEGTTGAEADRIAGLIAATYLELDEHGAALRWVEGIQAESLTKLRLKAQILSRTNPTDPVVLDLARSALELASARPESHLLVGSVLLARGAFAEADASFNRAKAMGADDARPLIALGVSQELRGRWNEAGDWFLKATECSRDRAEAYYCLGRARTKERKFREAIVCYGKAVELDPGNALAYNNRGAIEDDVLHALDDAVLDYEKATRCAPRLGIAHYNLGWAYHRQRRFNDAVVEYRAAERNGVRDALLYHNLAICLQWIGYGTVDEAGAAVAANLVAVQKTVENKKPINHVLCYNLASAYVWLKDETMAARWYAKAVEIAPNWPNAHTDLGLSLEALGNRGEALAEHRKSTLLDPKFAWGYLNETKLLLASADLEQPDGEELEATIARYEEGETLPNAGPGVRWLIERYRRRLAPGLASFASIDALFDGPQPVIAEDDALHYRFDTRDPAPDLGWTRGDYDDASWREGVAPFDAATEIGGAAPMGLYIRRSFDVPNPARIQRLLLSIHFEDGFAAYLNGVEVARVDPRERDAEATIDSAETRSTPARWKASDVWLDPKKVTIVRGKNILAVKGIAGVGPNHACALVPVLGAVYSFDEKRIAELEEKLHAFRVWGNEKGRNVASRIGYFESLLASKEGRYADAELRLREIPTTDANRPEPRWRAAELLLAKHETIAAVNLLHEALERRPDSHDKLWLAWLRVGLIDAGVSPQVLLDSFPPFQPPLHRLPIYNPNVPSDIRWLLETLAKKEPLRIHINCGGTGYRDSTGKLWTGDRFFLGGWADYLRNLDKLTGKPLDSALYQNERHFINLDPGPLIPGYRIPLPAGEYRITLHFMEGDLGQIHKRRFDVLLQHEPVLTDFEPFNEQFGRPKIVGPKAVSVRDGALEIEFVRKSGDPQISGFEIERIERDK